MADLAAMRTYLRDVIGITDPVERRQAIQNEGLTTFSDFAEFDKEEIETLCASVRKPGGTIPNPAAGAGAPATIPNPGHNIPAICEKRLVSAAYTAVIYDMIGRTVTQVSLSRTRLKKFDEHKLLISQHEDPEKLPVVSKSFGIMRAMDLVPSHLRERLGVRKVALSYIIRDVVNPPPIPEQAANSATSENYISIMDELIDYAPHGDRAYAEDNAKVYQILQDMVSGTSFESSIKTFQRSRDGRGAYLALCQHNLGSSKWDKIVEDAETYVMKREWNGKNPRFNLRAHISKTREAYNDMIRASQFISFQVPNEHTRVGRLIKSITSKDPAIVSAITHIHGNPQQRSNFELAADFLLLTAPSTQHQNSTHRVSAATTGNKPKGPKTGIELRYYKSSEYNNLNADQRAELRELRKADRKKRKGNTNTSENSNEVAALKTQMAELETRLIAAIASNQENSNDTDSQKKNPLSNPLNQRNQS